MSGMSDLDFRFAAALEERKMAGVLDIKVHVADKGDRGNHNPDDLKRVLLNIFGQGARGEIERVPLKSIPDFETLVALVRDEPVPQAI